MKHLEFFHLAAIQAVVCLSRLYGFAKENSGPLKPGVQAVEGTVMAVVGPVYDRFHDVPYEILRFVDRKVSEIRAVPILLPLLFSSPALFHGDLRTYSGTFPLLSVTAVGHHHRLVHCS